MAVNLEPTELGFKRPFTHEVSQILRLQNSNSEPVAFKVKTTAPKQYCVRPNSGRIEPGRDVEVQVLLQAMKEDPPVDARCRDKFLVQSVAISADQDSGSVTQIWSNIEQTAKSSIQEKKIRVSFLPADKPAATNGVASHEESPPAYTNSAATPQRGGEKSQDFSSPAQSATTPQASSTLQSATAAVSSATGISQADLQRKLDDANATIAQLRQQAADGLRQRKVGTDGATTKGSSTALQSAPPAGGVSIKIVALLCLIFFLVAYFFF